MTPPCTRPPKLCFNIFCAVVRPHINDYASSSIPHRQPPPSTALVGSFVCTFLAPIRQSIYMPALLVKFTLGFPIIASATSFLFDGINNPVGFLVAVVPFHRFAVSPVTQLRIFTITCLAPKPQSISRPEVLVEFALVFPLFTLAASFHFCPLVCVRSSFAFGSASFLSPLLSSVAYPPSSAISLSPLVQLLRPYQLVPHRQLLLNYSFAFFLLDFLPWAFPFLAFSSCPFASVW
jgi:hypothetical protein